MGPIKTSVFDLFKIGPGPSSSHTIGPMVAAARFLEAARGLASSVAEAAERVDVHLFGSLSATGPGHGTDRAVLAGLLGWRPETCDPAAFDRLLRDRETYAVDIAGREIPFGPENIHRGPVLHEFPFQNTLVFALSGGGRTILEQRYYSVGGGFVQWEGWREPELPDVPYPYETMAGLKSWLDRSGLALHELILANEQALTGKDGEEIRRGLDRILWVMEEAVEAGLERDGPLPGPIGLMRKAPILYRRARASLDSPDRFLILLNAYALAASEENASGGIVVTAPTSGASGVLPAIVYLLKHHFQRTRRELRQGLLSAAAVGFLIKRHASISGAEVGCQGEIGAAAAMSAAMLASVNGCSVDVAANAAEIALEHHLGLTCDPVAGYVQIPCIERNAVGAVKAYNAYLLASSGDPARHKIELDKVIRVMWETGRDMCAKYKETSQGGLAMSMPEC